MLCGGNKDFPELEFLVAFCCVEATRIRLDCNPESLEILQNCKVEAALKNATAPASFQFMRLGYFCVDSKDSRAEKPVFNRSVSLKDSFKK